MWGVCGGVLYRADKLKVALPSRFYSPIESAVHTFVISCGCSSPDYSFCFSGVGTLDRYGTGETLSSPCKDNALTVTSKI